MDVLYTQCLGHSRAIEDAKFEVERMFTILQTCQRTCRELSVGLENGMLSEVALLEWKRKFFAARVTFANNITEIAWDERTANGQQMPPRILGHMEGCLNDVKRMLCILNPANPAYQEYVPRAGDDREEARGMDGSKYREYVSTVVPDLRNYADVLQAYHDKYKHILVDPKFENRDIDTARDMPIIFGLEDSIRKILEKSNGPECDEAAKSILDEIKGIFFWETRNAHAFGFHVLCDDGVNRNGKYALFDCAGTEYKIL